MSINDPTSAAYEALVQDGFIDALIEHYLSHQERYKTADAETQELDYESFITEWSGKLSKLLAEAETRGRKGLLEYFDQVPSNDLMDWKGLFADVRAQLDYEEKQANADGANGRDGEDT